MPLSAGSMRPWRVDPAIGGFERARGPAPHAERFRQRIIGVDEAADRKLRRFASALVAADAVGDGGDDVAVGVAALAEAGARHSPHWPARLPVSLAKPTRTPRLRCEPFATLRDRLGMARRRQTRAPDTAPQVVRQRTLTMASPRNPSNASDAEKQEAGAEPAGHALGGAERLGQEEAADAAGAADHAGHQADLVTEAQRNELEHRAVAHAEREHADREQQHRDPGDARHLGQRPAARRSARSGPSGMKAMTT